MKSAQFQEEALKCVKKLLKKGTVKGSRIANIAKGALEVSVKHPREVPIKSMGMFIEAFPECGSFFKKKVEEADEAERKENVESIRSRIG